MLYVGKLWCVGFNDWLESYNFTRIMPAEYIWNYFFYQDGSIEFEIRLTGILQVYVSKPSEPSPYGTFVAPQINAHYHQHLFSLRVDPMVDGLNNSVVESDVIPLPNAPTGSKENYAGNAFVVVERTIADAREGACRCRLHALGGAGPSTRKV